MIFFIIGVLIAFAYYSHYRYLNLSCQGYPTTWCFNDWKCKNPNDLTGSTVINMSEYALLGITGTSWRCTNLTEDTVKKFVYAETSICTDAQSNPIPGCVPGTYLYTKFPEYEVNIWALNDQGQPCNQTTTTNQCPFYEIGDVYWPACNGTPNSTPYYVSPNVYLKTSQDAITRKQQDLAKGVQDPLPGATTSSYQ